MKPETYSASEGVLKEFESELNQITNALPQRINTDPDKVEQGLGKLVLTLIELLRKLMERQALRRVEGGTLTEEEIERVGLAFLRLEQKMKELKAHFGLTDEDLNIDLGPLGRLM